MCLKSFIRVVALVSGFVGIVWLSACTIPASGFLPFPSSPSPIPTRATPTATAFVASSTPPPSAEEAVIQGRVWHDLCDGSGGEGCMLTETGDYQANGEFEAGEPGIGRIWVQLGRGSCPSSDFRATTTNADGLFFFTGLKPGTYCVSVDAFHGKNAHLLPGRWTFPAVEDQHPVADHTLTLEVGTSVEINFGWDYERRPVPRPPQTVPQPSPPALTPTPISSPSPTATPRCTDQVTIIESTTDPAGPSVAPETAFVQTWRLRNSGTCLWNTDYTLTFVEGDAMDAPPRVPLPDSVPPGEVIEVSLRLFAPASTGVAEGIWRLHDADDEPVNDETGMPSRLEANVAVMPPATATATPTSTPLPTPVPVVSPTPTYAGWRGEYYRNPDLAGEPMVIRNETVEALNFNWGDAAPAGLPADGFSARWTRTFLLEAGTYRFYALSDDGVRVWLDDELIINQWHDAVPVVHVAERTLGYRGSDIHTLRVVYYENLGTARLHFWWERAEDLGPGEDFSKWRGAYFATMDLSGSPTVLRNDAAVTFDWGTEAPAPGLPADGFSARWTRVLNFSEGEYRFHVIADDGARLYVDDILRVDAWRDAVGQQVTQEIRLWDGYHSLRVEYYERGGLAQIEAWWEKTELDPYPDWKAEYWPNRDLSGNPVLVRNDENVHFEWGLDAPDEILPVDGFSARWSRWMTFEPGRYLLNAAADDGVRVYIDDDLVLNEWHISDGEALYEAEVNLAGRHRVVVAYYENGGEARVTFWWDRIAEQDAPEVYAEGMDVIHTQACFDLDAGREWTDYNVACDFSAASMAHENQIELIPVSTAAFGMPYTTQASPTRAQCMAASLSSAVMGMPLGRPVCYRTAEGRYGYLHFNRVDMTPDFMATFEWRTFE